MLAPGKDGRLGGSAATQREKEISMGSGKEIDRERERNMDEKVSAEALI